MKNIHKLLASSIIILALGGVLYNAKRVGPDYLYPPSYKIATTSYTELTKDFNGQTYSKAHRKLRTSDKCEGEKDHTVPLSLGGADDPKNLWCQPEVNKWNDVNYGFREKDRLEFYLYQQMKSKNVTVKEAQKKITEDWVREYRKMNNFGGLAVDPDDVP